MMGLPATCKKVVPMPRRKMQARSNWKLGTMRVGTATAMVFKARPMRRRFFLPMRAASRPPGTLKAAKAIKTKKGKSLAMTVLML